MASAMIPYKYNGKYYALPETQSYDMLFYRTDVFEELGLVPPETWQDFYEMIPILQQNNMLIGIPESQRTFEALLYQNDGQFIPTICPRRRLTSRKRWLPSKHGPICTRNTACRWCSISSAVSAPAKCRWLSCPTLRSTT